jgi:hypothetical protein
MPSALSQVLTLNTLGCMGPVQYTMASIGDTLVMLGSWCGVVTPLVDVCTLFACCWPLVGS